MGKRPEYIPRLESYRKDPRVLDEWFSHEVYQGSDRTKCVFCFSFVSPVYYDRATSIEGRPSVTNEKLNITITCCSNCAEKKAQIDMSIAKLKSNYEAIVKGTFVPLSSYYQHARYLDDVLTRSNNCILCDTVAPYQFSCIPIPVKHTPEMSGGIVKVCDECRKQIDITLGVTSDTLFFGIKAVYTRMCKYCETPYSINAEENKFRKALPIILQNEYLCTCCAVTALNDAHEPHKYTLSPLSNNRMDGFTCSCGKSTYVDLMLSIEALDTIYKGQRGMCGTCAEAGDILDYKQTPLAKGKIQVDYLFSNESEVVFKKVVYDTVSDKSEVVGFLQKPMSLVLYQQYNHFIKYGNLDLPF